MRFSMEAMGIDLAGVSKDILKHSIIWNNEYENSYCTVMGSVNFNDLCEDDLKKIILDMI